MKTGPTKAKVTIEQWVRPGEHQTVEELVQKFQGRIIAIQDGEILVSVSEDIVEVENGFAHRELGIGEQR